MTFVDRIEVLRRRNKYLLNRLKQRGEQLMRLQGCGPSGVVEPTVGEEEWRDPAEVPTVSGGQDGHPAEPDLAKPVLRPGDSSVEQAGARLATLSTAVSWERSQPPADPAAAPSDGSTCPSQVLDKRPTSTETRRVTHSPEQDVRSRDSSRLRESNGTSDRRRSRPLLGYDWIAGILDAEDSLAERSDKFFSDLQAFRSLNRDKCVYSPPTHENSTGDCGPSMLGDSCSPDADVDAHQCMFPYMMNDRFFLIPRHSEERCAVCKMPKARHPHTECDPALVRVSIPCSVILPAHKYKAHRRCSFDPSDGLGLPAHCLSGWSNKCQSQLQPRTGLDLQSNMKSSAGTQTNEVEIVPAPEEAAEVSEVSRLPPFNFQHFSPKRRRPSTFQPSP
ncbi:migration and invasion inhibitory protein isoform X2 [Nelusetta ayraudi]|uniref:migration and invasion inhibitory protein isoform X2 n=1 Tax=Nelusetta ayraudi TaxID=303726 RepID=UPI003F719D68